MYRTIYHIILIYFLLGAIGFYFINRKKPFDQARKNRIKYISYFVIINAVFFSIVIQPVIFRYITILIILGAVFDLLFLYVKSGYRNSKAFILGICTLIFFAIGFYKYSKLDKGVILYTFLVLSIFDSFSQISGQLFGQKKILPAISPNKTLGGIIGGTVVAFISAFLLRDLYLGSLFKQCITVTGIITFGFIGDVLASYYKRNFDVKDFNNLIPGHGGVLDRFDSIITAGAWVAYIQIINF